MLIKKESEELFIVKENLSLQNHKLKQKLKEKMHNADHFEALYTKASEEAKEYYNQWIDSDGRIRVFCRVRPMTEKEENNKCQEVIEVVNETELKFKVNLEIV